MVLSCNGEEHLANLEEELKRLLDAWLRIKRKDCSLMVDGLVYLGHTIYS